MKLPYFIYHPNPLKTGAIIESDAVCECCGLSNGYLYQGPIYATANIENLCPWCIADGRASEKYKASFTCGAFGDEPPLNKTIGFSSFQELEQWPYHCDDYCEFHGEATTGDFKKISKSEVERLLAETSLDETEIEELKTGSENNGTHYYMKFICRKCQEIYILEDLD
jgi:uncharacterized protein CbrC (UPF0167 family)